MPTTQKQTATEFRTETILKIANKKVLAQSDIRELIRHLALGYAEMVDAYSTTNKFIYGNGHPPLDSRMTAIEGTVKAMNDKMDIFIKKELKTEPNKRGIKEYFRKSVVPNVVSALTVWLFSAIAVAVVIVFFPVFEQMARHVVGLP